jgi:hypothetical protein
LPLVILKNCILKWLLVLHPSSNVQSQWTISTILNFYTPSY